MNDDSILTLQRNFAGMVVVVVVRGGLDKHSGFCQSRFTLACHITVVFTESFVVCHPEFYHSD